MLGLQTGLLYKGPLRITRCMWFSFFKYFININSLPLDYLYIYYTTVIFLQNIFVLKSHYDVFFNVKAENSTVYYILSRKIPGFIHWLKVTSIFTGWYYHTVKTSEWYIYSVKITSDSLDEKYRFSIAETPLKLCWNLRIRMVSA